MKKEKVKPNTGPNPILCSLERKYLLFNNIDKNSIHIFLSIMNFPDRL